MIRTWDSRKHIFWSTVQLGLPGPSPLLSVPNGVPQPPASAHWTLISCRSSGPVLFPPGSVQGLSQESGVLPHSAIGLSVNHRFCFFTTMKPLWLTLLIIITQGLLNYYPHQLFFSEFCIRNHLISPEEQVHILLSEKKSYVIHHAPSLL